MAERVVCYVCGNKGSQDKMLYLTGGIWRHKSRCKPGSKTWMDSKVGKASPSRQYFKAPVDVIPLVWDENLKSLVRKEGE